jgi:hypothetical protein
MRGLLAALAAFPLLLAGCSDGGAGPPAPAGPRLEGWVVDEAHVPVEGASVALQGLGGNATATDEEGHFALDAPSGVDLLLVVHATGFHSASRLVPAFSGGEHVLNFSLERLPLAAPFHQASSFRGTVSCGVTVVLQEDPDNPHEHQGVRCDAALPAGQNNVWNYTLPANTTGLVLEGFWEPQTPMSEALVVKAEVVGTGQVLAFLESMSPLRVQMSSANVADAQAVTVTPGAGTGSHEHGAAGLFVEQEFQLVMTAFFNGPVDPSYSVAAAGGGR